MITKMLTAIVVMYALLLWQQGTLWFLVRALRTQIVYNRLASHLVKIPSHLLKDFADDEVR